MNEVPKIKWLMWLKRLTLWYLAIGVVVAVIFLAISGFNVDLTWDMFRVFLSIILLWPVWVWFMVVMWLATQGNKRRG